MQSEKKRVANSASSIRPKDARTDDMGKVKLGGTSPSLPPVKAGSPAIVDGGKIRLGGTAPSF
jgi:hypothetical protein